MRGLGVAVLLAVAVVAVQGISLPVSSMKERCMIVSSNSREQLLKADLQFKRFGEQALEEGYRIVLHNTETHEEQAYQISEGSFRKEFQLTEHIVYKFCFKIVLTRFREVRAVMEYNADITHREIPFDSTVSVPAGLLKVQDLKETYQTMVNFLSVLKQAREAAPSLKNEEDVVFEEQSQQMKTLTFISISEIVVVVAFGIYQYFRLKNLIQNKH